MSTTWDELEQKYGPQGTIPSTTSGDPWSALEQKYTAPRHTVGSALPTQTGAEHEKEVTLPDRVRAAATGVNRGFFTDLLGLPVDTAANVIDLGKAAAGYATSKITGNAPPAWTEPYDRATVPFAADWLADKFNKAGLGDAINNPNPQDVSSRVLHAGGRVAGASVSPDPRAKIGGMQQLVNLGMGTTSGLSAGAMGELAPEWAGVAAMLPPVATAAGATALRLGGRGGESGRRNMEQRIQDFKNAGVDEPSVGLASGKKTIMGVENLLSQTPGSINLYDAARTRMIEGMRGKAAQLRDSVSPVYGPAEAGAAIQSDLKGSFKNRINTTYGLLNDRVEKAVGANTPVPAIESILKSGQLTTPIPGATATSSNFINSRIAKIHGDLVADSGSRPAQIINSPILLPNGSPASQTVLPAVPPVGVPFSALKDLRTRIGKESQSNAIIGTPEQADFKQLYGAMSGDMRNAVAAADASNGTNSATRSLNRANAYYSKAMDRNDDLNPLANRSTPEGAYNSAAGSLNAGPTVYQRLRNAVTPATRQKIVATVVDELGMAGPGQQNAAGDVWSARSFLTNFNKLDPQSRGELFKRIPGGAKHAESLNDIAKAAEMVGEGSKIWANPSGTAPAITARGTIYALTAGAYFNPLLSAATASGLGLGHQTSQRLLLNPKFVNWLAKAPQVPPAQARSYAQRLIANAGMTNDPQFKEDVNDYLSLVEQIFDGAE